MNAGIGHNHPPAHTRLAIKEAILFNRNETRRTLTNPQGHLYNVDRLYADEYLAMQPKWKDLVRAYLRALRVQGERVVHVDICGTAMGHSLGAEISYCFALNAGVLWRRGKPGSHELIRGDIFCMRDFYSFVAHVRDKEGTIALATFCPIVGLQSYSPWDHDSGRETELHPRVTWQRLENNLRRLVQTMRPGGYIFIARPFSLGDPDTVCFLRKMQPKDYTSVQWMKKFCRRNHCKIRYQRTITGIEFLLQKSETWVSS